MEKYNTYSTEDFLSDAGFIRWVKEGAEEERQTMGRMAKSQPENLKAYQQALLILRTVLTAERIEPAKILAQAYLPIFRRVLDNKKNEIKLSNG
jgi:hypothetical protein